MTVKIGMGGSALDLSDARVWGYPAERIMAGTGTSAVEVWSAVITVTPVAPTFHDGEPWVTLPTQAGVTYSVSGKPGYSASVTVTATAQPGYELVGTASWSHTFGPDPRPVVTITGTSSNVSRDQFRQACVDFGTTFGTVEVLPFRLDTSQATNMSYMFHSCSSLTQVSNLDTSQATDLSFMFRNCSSLTQVSNLDTSQVTSMSYMFRGCSSLTSVSDLDTSQVTSVSYMFMDCASLTSVPDMDTSNVTSTSYMFNGCTLLTDGNVRLIGKHPTVNTNSMITASGLTREPFYDVNGNPI